MGKKIDFNEIKTQRKMNDKGEVISEVTKTFTTSFDFDEIEDRRVAIDANMMTSAILNQDFKEILKSNISDDFPYTTKKCKKETIGNIKYKLNLSWSEAINKFEELENELTLRFLDYEDRDYTQGWEFYDNVIKSSLKIKNKKTFLADCVNIAILERNKVKTFFCNDEDLAKACKFFKKNIEFIRIADSPEKLRKDFFNQYHKEHRQKKRKSRR